MPRQTRRSQTAQLLKELVDGRLMDELEASEPSPETIRTRERLDRELEEALRENAQNRRESWVWARTKMLD